MSREMGNQRGDGKRGTAGAGAGGKGRGAFRELGSGVGSGLARETDRVRKLGIGRNKETSGSCLGTQAGIGPRGWPVDGELKAEKASSPGSIAGWSAEERLASVEKRDGAVGLAEAGGSRDSEISEISGISGIFLPAVAAVVSLPAIPAAAAIPGPSMASAVDSRGESGPRFALESGWELGVAPGGPAAAGKLGSGAIEGEGTRSSAVGLTPDSGRSLGGGNCVGKGLIILFSLK